MGFRVEGLGFRAGNMSVYENKGPPHKRIPNSLIYLFIIGTARSYPPSAQTLKCLVGYHEMHSKREPALSFGDFPRTLGPRTLNPKA